MAKRPEKPKAEPLTIGDAFAVPLADGRLGACRVLRAGAPGEFFGADARLVVASVYVGAAPPAIDHPDVRRPLVFDHHAYGRSPQPQVLSAWLTGPIPDGYVRLGNLPVTPREQQVRPINFVAWYAIAQGILQQWRWDHDREAVLAEDKAALAAAEARRAELEQLKRRERETMTYASFRQQKLFKDWTDHPPKKMAAASRKLMKETAARLEALGPHPDREAARAILRECILAFNRLDEENDHWIETVEREDICGHFYELAYLAGLEDEPDLADEWREW